MNPVRPVRFVTTLAACLALLPAATGREQVPLGRRASRQPGRPALEQAFLDAHNKLRAGVGLAPLRWSESLASHAQDWADTLLARREFSHRPESPYGENLFEITGATASAAAVVAVWASESRNYDHRTDTCRGRCGHYTQLVWRDTLRLGCAVARGDGREVYVCYYDPPGNRVGERPF